MKATLKIASSIFLKSVIMCLLFSIILVFSTLNSNHPFLTGVPLESTTNYQHIDDIQELTEDMEVAFLKDLVFYLNPSENFQSKCLLINLKRLSDMEIPTPPPESYCI